MMGVNRSSGVVRSDAEPAAPGAASAARAGVRISVAGRSDVPQGRVGPALLRMAPTMQLPCRRLRRPAARRSRRWPLASCSAPMASRLRCLSRTAGDASLASATASAATTASASIKGFRFTPSCPARSPMASPSRRLPHVRMAPLAGFVAAARIPRPAPARPSMGRHGGVRAHGAHPPCGPRCLAHRRRKWHLGVGVHKQWSPRPCRIPAGCPVSRSGRNGSRPTAVRRPLNGAQYTSGTKAAPEKSC